MPETRAFSPPPRGEDSRKIFVRGFPGRALRFQEPVVVQWGWHPFHTGMGGHAKLEWTHSKSSEWLGLPTILIKIKVGIKVSLNEKD